MHVTYESFVSVFSSKWNDCHAWNNCSLVLPIFQYCCQNRNCKPCQCTFIGSKDSYHNLASPTNVRQNLWTLIFSWKWCMLIQLLVLSKWTSASSSGFPENFGLKCYQFKWTICCACCAGCVSCCPYCVGCAGCCGACGGVEVLEYLVLAVLLLPYFTYFKFTMMCYVLFYQTYVLVIFLYILTLLSYSMSHSLLIFTAFALYSIYESTLCLD